MIFLFLYFALLAQVEGLDLGDEVTALSAHLEDQHGEVLNFIEAGDVGHVVGLSTGAGHRLLSDAFSLVDEERDGEEAEAEAEELVDAPALTEFAAGAAADSFEEKWLFGGEGQDCYDACDGKKLFCYDDLLYWANSEVDSCEKITKVTEALEKVSGTCRESQDPGTPSDTPPNLFGRYLNYAPARMRRSAFSCSDRAGDKGKRLCYCTSDGRLVESLYTRLVTDVCQKAANASLDHCPESYYVVTGKNVWSVSDFNTLERSRGELGKAAYLDVAGEYVKDKLDLGLTREVVKTLRSCTRALSFSALAMQDMDEGTRLVADTVLWDQLNCSSVSGTTLLSSLEVTTNIKDAGWEADFENCATQCVRSASCKAFEYPRTPGQCKLLSSFKCNPYPTTKAQRMLIVKASVNDDAAADIRCKGKWLPPTTTTATTTTTSAWVRVRWRRSGRRSEHLLSELGRSFKRSRKARKLTYGLEVELLPGSRLRTGLMNVFNIFYSPIEDCDEEEDCPGGQRGRLIDYEASFFDIDDGIPGHVVEDYGMIKWYTGEVSTNTPNEVIDACWPLGEAPALLLGAMVRILPGVIFDGRNTEEERIAMVRAVGCVYRRDDKVVHIVSHITGRHFELPADAWFDTVETLDEVLQFNFADEVEVLPNTSVTSDRGDHIKAGAKGRVCECLEVGPAEEVICVAWYQSGRATQVPSPFMHLKPSKGRKLSNAVEVKVYGALEGQDAGSADAATPCATGELGRARVLEDRVEVTCYSGTRSTFPRTKWPEGFEIVGEALQLEPGLELELLPGPGQATDKSAGQSCIKGRIASVAEDSDNVTVVLYDGSLRATSKADWFSSFKKVGERYKVAAGDELEALPRGDDASGCPGAHRHRHKGRVSTLEQGLRMAWYDGPKDETPYSAEDWFKCFKLTGKARTLARYEEVRAVGAATGGPEPGEPGRIISIEDGEIFVAWDKGAVTTVAAAEWVNELRYVSEAVTLELTCEVALRPARDEPGADPVRGRVVELGQARADLAREPIVQPQDFITVMLYNGSAVSGRTAEWPKHFIFKDGARSLEEGYELKVLQNRECHAGDDGSDCVRVAPGSQGRLTSVAPQGNFTAVWYNDGTTFVGAQEGWARDFLLTSDKVRFEEGIELRVIHGKNYYEKDYEKVYLAGWVGRLVSFDGNTKECCIRWYNHTKIVCFKETGWMNYFQYLGEGRALKLGLELELLTGEECPKLAPAPGGLESPESSISQRIINFETLSSRRFLSALEAPSPPHWLLDVPSDGDDDDYSKFKTCDQAHPQGSDAAPIVPLKYRDVIHRGRITKVDAERFCVTWYTGLTSCEPLNKKAEWTKRYQLTSEAVDLKTDAVVEVLDNEEARELWGQGLAGHWAVVTEAAEAEANPSSKRLCLRWTTDPKAEEPRCREDSSRWESSLRYLGTTQGEAQVASAAEGHVIKANAAVREIVKQGMEGAISWTNGTDFCATWITKFKACCTCHSRAELESTNNFVILRYEAQSTRPSSCKDKGVEPDVCYAEGLGALQWALIVAGVVLLLLLVLALLYVLCPRSSESEPAGAEFQMELPQYKSEVHVHLISDKSPAAVANEESMSVCCGTTLTGFEVAEHQFTVSANSKFSNMVHCLKTGDSGAAATGLNQFLKISGDDLAALAHDPMEAMIVEWNVFLDTVGEHEDQLDVPEEERQGKRMMELFEYIVYGTAEEIEERSNDGHSIVVRDRGNQGLTLNDFHLKEQSQKAELTVAQVAALRIYTSELFKYINPPFRSPENLHGFKEPHPVGLTVILISEGLHNLRKLNAGDNHITNFWRGMKDLVIPREFEQAGGTELQCMSTTANVDIAAAYGQSDTPLLFCVQSDSFMTRGADISWLSLYPHEKEILYPPLTYLQYISKRKIKNSKGYIVYVKPHMN